MGPLNQDMKSTSSPLAKKYRDASGKARCVGKKEELKNSQWLDVVNLLLSNPVPVDIVRIFHVRHNLSMVSYLGSTLFFLEQNLGLNT